MDSIDKLAQEALIQKNIGKRIQQLRKEKKLNTVTLAEKSGISQGQLSKIENGKATISIKNLAAICRVLDHPVSDLFQSEGRTQTCQRPMTIVTAIAGRDTLPVRAITASTETIFAKGTASLWFSDKALTAPGAAYVNSTLASAQYLDDGHRQTMGHLGASIIPAAIAVAEETQCH